MNVITAAPAYGRDYPTEKAAMKAWLNGEDWQISSLVMGRYINEEDIEFTKEAGFTHIKLRFNKLTDSVLIKL